jgi:hypothetical protein
MATPSEPVGAQEREAEIDEKARRNRKAKDQIEHSLPSHPFCGAYAECESRECDQANHYVDNVQHRVSPGG